MADNRNIVNDTKIRVAVSDPALAEKVKINLPDASEPVFWYIKFNTELDAVSVNHKSMRVTEENGYILETEITYDTKKHLIVIKPIDPYEEGIYYILTISKKVSSKGGNKLRRDIYILFKIKDKRIDEYRALPPDTVVEKPRKKPEKLKRETAARAYTSEASLKIEKTAAAALPTLPYGKMGINVLVAGLSMPVVILGLLSQTDSWIYSGTGILLLGIIHLIIQMINKKKRACVVYNAGVVLFNAGRYKGAAKRLEKAAKLDPMNELAEYAISRVKYYI